MNVDYEVFARQWNAAKTLTELSNTLGGMPKQTLQSRAKKAKRLGYNIKSFQASNLNRSEFIRIWNSANSVAEVAKRLGRTKASVRSSASYLREEGENLKSMQKARRKKVFDLAQAFPDLDPQPSHYSGDVLALMQCAHCGSAWHGEYTVTAWTADGDGYKVAGEATIDEAEEWHHSVCPEK